MPLNHQDQELTRARMDLRDVLVTLDHRALQAEARAQAPKATPEVKAGEAFRAAALTEAIDLLDDQLAWLVGRWRREGSARGTAPTPRTAQPVGTVNDPDFQLPAHSE